MAGKLTSGVPFRVLDALQASGDLNRDGLAAELSGCTRHDVMQAARYLTSINAVEITYRITKAGELALEDAKNRGLSAAPPNASTVQREYGLATTDAQIERIRKQAIEARELGYESLNQRYARERT